MWGLFWPFSTRSQNNEGEGAFIHAITSNLIDTESITKSLYRTSEKQYFDEEFYPRPKPNTNYSPIWFSLNEQDCLFYMKTHTSKLNSMILVNYSVKPDYKILNLRQENNQLNLEVMQILVDHVINVIQKDNIKSTNIINKMKTDNTVKGLIANKNDTAILQDLLDRFKGIYQNTRTNYKLIDELLFQEIINEMIRLNLVKDLNIIGFWNGFSLIPYHNDDVIPEEIVIIANRMRECLQLIRVIDNSSPTIESVNPEPPIEEQPIEEPINKDQMNPKIKSIAQLNEKKKKKIKKKNEIKKNKRQEKLNSLRIPPYIGGKKYKKYTLKNSRTKFKNSRTKFKNSRTKFKKSRTKFKNSRTKFKKNKKNKKY